ncbi:MAG: hypothetical protein HKN44_15915 [Ilumatobacter sp.]|nr:hypothetical protein [Ilumatobacter sp.]
MGLQLVRGAAPGRAVVPDRLRQPVPGLTGDVAALSLPVADRRQPPLVAVLRRHQPTNATEPRLAAVLHHRRHRRAVRGEVAGVRSDRPRATPGRRVRGVLWRAPRPPRSGAVGLLRHRHRPRGRADEGHRAVPRARGRRVHRDVLGPHPDVAQGCDAVTKLVDSWHSQHLDRSVEVARWGDVGRPVLVFPTAGGDAQEIERFQVVDACSELIADGRVKVYSCDSVNGRAMLVGEGDSLHRSWLLRRFIEFIGHELVPAIRADCQSEDISIIAAGASIGAYNALAALCRYPHAFTDAICMSGTYDLDRFMRGPTNEHFWWASPLHHLDGLGDDHLALLRSRSVILACGGGANEDIGESWKAANALGAAGVPNRVDAWGAEWPHDWQTWRAMLPHYLGDLV